MPATVNHVFTSPIADGTNTQLVRPSNWNSSHLATFNAVGSEISGAFSNAIGGVTFGLETNGYVTGSAPAGGGGLTNINLSAGTTSNNLSAFQFNNGNGLTFGLDGSTVTASHNGLTTAMASNRGSDFVQATAAFAGTNASGTIASNGISMSVGNYITTARASNDAIGLNTALTAGPLAWTANSAGLSLNAGSAAGTTSGFAGNSISGSMTHNTAGLNLSLNHPAWLTTAAQSNHSHGNPTLALTNLSGTTASSSNGLTLSLSAAAGGGGTQSIYAAGNTTQSSSGTYTNALSFNGAGIASVGITNGSVVVSVPSGGGAGDGVNVVQAGTTGTTGTTWSSLSGTVGINGSGNITVSQNNSNQIVVIGPAPATATMWFPFNEAVNVAGQQGQGTMNLAPVPTPGNIGGNGIVSIDRLCLPIIVSASSNSSGSATISHWFGLYTRTSNSISLAHSTSATLGVTYSGNANTTAYSGVRLFTIPWTTSFDDNRYVVAHVSRTTSAGTNATISQVLISNMNSNFSGLMNVATNASYQWPFGWGVYSATTSGLPNSIAYSQIVGTGSLAMRNPSWFMVNGTV